MDKDSRTFTETDWAEVGVELPERSMARGHVAVVRGTLLSTKWMAKFQLLERDRMIELLERSREWLRVSEDYEALHGADSLMDRDDPFTANVRRAREDVRAMDRRRSERRVAPRVDGGSNDRLI